MIAHGHERRHPTFRNERPHRPLTETVRTIELCRIAAQRDDLTAAAIATSVVLLLPRLDALIEQGERVR